MQMVTQALIEEFEHVSRAPVEPHGSHHHNGQPHQSLRILKSHNQQLDHKDMESSKNSASAMSTNITISLAHSPATDSRTMILSREAAEVDHGEQLEAPLLLR